MMEVMMKNPRSRMYLDNNQLELLKEELMQGKIPMLKLRNHLDLSQLNLKSEQWRLINPSLK